MIPGNLALLLRYCRRSKSLGLRCTHKSGIMATEASESHLPAMPESDAIEKLEQKSSSEVVGEPRVPQQGDLNDKYIKAEGGDNVKDAGFEFVDYRTLIKQERSSEENPFPNTTYSTSENLISEMESDSKDIRVNTETFKAELSDSATNTDFEAEAETVPLKAETAASGQDVKVEIETIPIIDSERESGSTTEAAAKLQPENAGTSPKNNHNEEAVQPNNPYNAAFCGWLQTEWQKKTEPTGGKRRHERGRRVTLHEDVKRRKRTEYYHKWCMSKQANQIDEKMLQRAQKAAETREKRLRGEEDASQHQNDNQSEEAVQPKNQYSAEFHKWLQTEWEKKSEPTVSKKQPE